MIENIKNWFLNKTFSKKIFFSYLFFCIIPFFISTVITSVLFINIFYGKFAASIKDSNNKIAILLEDKLSHYEYVVDSLIYDNTFLCILQNNDDGIITPYEVNSYINEQLSELQISMPEISSFYIYSNAPIQNDYFKPLEAFDGNSYDKSITDNSDSIWYSKEKNVYASYTIKNPYTEEFLGILELCVDMNSMVKSFSEISADNYGIYMYGPTGSLLYGKESFSFEIGRITEHMLAENAERTFIAGKYFIVNRASTDHGINIYCITPTSSVYKPILNYLSIPLIVWVTCLFLVINLCYFLSRSLSKRVKKLEVQMENVSKGDLKVFEPETCTDEIGNISRFCSSAIAELNKLIEENYISQIKLQHAQNKALIAQINPHFLYNTLNMIAGQAIITENLIIADVVTQLSNYYRTTLNKGQNLILIKDELLNVKSYCNLQLRLHDYSFKVNYNINSSIENYFTVNLCLQPLVENAIEHGIHNLTDASGVIDITADFEDTDILFCVSNNGSPPIDCDADVFIKNKAGGYGLKNINERIHIVFGEKYGLSLQCSNNIFKAIIKIPAVSDPEQTFLYNNGKGEEDKH